MKAKMILVYTFCAVIIACAWVVCFLPTIFYKNPLEMPSNENHRNASNARYVLWVYILLHTSETAKSCEILTSTSEGQLEKEIYQDRR